MTPVSDTRAARPFDLDDAAAYRRWRTAKLARYPRRVKEISVDVGDPFALTPGERDAIGACLGRANMVVYRGPRDAADASVPRALGRQLGLQRLDANWLADEDGVSRIQVSPQEDERGSFIPYTDRAIRWHTDGYYHPQARRILGMVLHCVRPAAAGGSNALLDHELAYMALRDADPAFVAALSAPDALTIPGRPGPDGTARAAQTGPVFSLDPGGSLHMRYTARTRSIEWKADAATRAAVAWLERWLQGPDAPALHVRLDAGMGIIANNVLHDRSAFTDDAARPRLLLRARYLDRACAAPPPAAQAPAGGLPWRNG